MASISRYRRQAVLLQEPRKYQQVQHIIGMPLQLIIIGMLQSFIIFIINAQQLFIISMLIPGIGMILHFMQSASTVHSITHFIIGIGTPIGIIMGMFMVDIMDIIAMPPSDMHIIDMLPQCIIIGMPQFIIIAIMSALFLNIAMSMPDAGIMVHIMASSIMSQLMVAIIIGMPIIGIIGMAVFIGICMAFIMVETPKKKGLLKADGPILKRLRNAARRQPSSANECSSGVFSDHGSHPVCCNLISSATAYLLTAKPGKST